MIRLVRDFRIVPIALVAITCLFVLKSFGLVFEGHYTLGGSITNDGDVTGTAAPPSAATASPDAPAAQPEARRAPRRSWAAQMFNYPDTTGSVGESDSGAPAQPKAKGAAAKNPPAGPDGTPVPIEGGRIQSLAERAILERLSERRAELDARAKELETREGLIAAAEKRLEGRIAQLKQLEERISDAVQAKDEAEAARFKGVITMYENMKAKDAARIFDRLDMRVLLDVAAKINPRRMSDIMAQMSPEAAERLTVELATRAKDKPPAELPKIEGKLTSAN
jgi:flagellar motility protein MotE (MotC chaperone)